MNAIRSHPPGPPPWCHPSFHMVYSFQARYPWPARAIARRSEAIFSGAPAFRIGTAYGEALRAPRKRGRIRARGHLRCGFSGRSEPRLEAGALPEGLAGVGPGTRSRCWCGRRPACARDRSRIRRANMKCESDFPRWAQSRPEERFSLSHGSIALREISSDRCSMGPQGLSYNMSQLVRSRWWPPLGDRKS